jgi:hypothetical protein
MEGETPAGADRGVAAKPPPVTFQFIRVSCTASSASSQFLSTVYVMANSDRSYGSISLWNSLELPARIAAMQYKESVLARVFENIASSHLVPRGFFTSYVRDSAKWLGGQALEPCDAGRNSIAIDASGNVSACLAHPHAGNLQLSDMSEILRRFDRGAIDRCSNASSATSFALVF